MTRAVCAAAYTSGVVVVLLVVLAAYVWVSPHAGEPSPEPGPVPTRAVRA